MAYNLTAQLNLQAPSRSSLKRIRSKIERGLRGIPLDIDTNSIAKAKKQIDDITKKTSKIQVEAEAKNLPKVRQEVEKTGKSLDNASEKAKNFADVIALKAVNYLPYALASAAVIKITGALSSATREAIKYEQELAKIAQVTGKTVDETINHSSALNKIAVEYNLTLNKVAQVTRVITQTGRSFREATQAAEALARTTLLATFDSIDSTTEGLIATMNSFNLTIGEGVASLDAINAVSKRFAIESGDIVEAVRRAGGAYAAAGGEIDEFIAQLTAVRSTSRESAETISTGFRTIFGRLQRPKTIQYFKDLGIELTKLDGEVVAPFEAIQRISDGLERLGIKAGTVKFAEVVEQVGGIRQLSKVVPLLQQTEKAQEALEAQSNASIETDKDVAKAKQTLGYRLGQLQKNFQSLISELVQTDSFKALAGTFIDIANGILSILRAIKPLIPLLTLLATIKIGRGLLDIIKGVRSRIPSGEGGSGGGMLGLASGGFVPGSGNRDTVPALLTPGEFVINKKSAQAIGYSQLNRINKYAKGGIVQRYQQGGETEPSNVISSLEEGISILHKVIQAMGEGGKNLLEALNVVEINDPGYRGKYSPKTNTIGLNIGAANSRTVAEEAFHALDFQKGGRKYASQQEGTFENRLAEIAKKTIQYKLEKAVEEGRISQQTLEYMLDAREAYAKLAKNSSPQIQAIIAAQGSVEDKMLALAEAFEDPKNDPRGIFSGIGVNIAKEAGYKPSVPKEEVLYEPRLMSLIDAQRERDERTKKADLFSEIEFQSFLEKANKSGVGEADLLEIIKAQVKAEKKVDLEAIIKEQIKARNKFDLFAKIKEESDKTKSKLALLSSALSTGVKKVLDWTDKLDSKKIATFNASLVAGAAALKNFLGKEVNQEVLASSTARSQITSEGADFIKGALSRKNVRATGNAIGKFGKIVSKVTPTFGSGIKKLGATVFDAAPKIVKFGATIGKVGNIIGGLDALSGFIDAVFSKDYTKDIQNSIAAGDAAKAAALAQKKYAQELNRAIPLLGGVLNAFGADFSNYIGSGDNNAFSKSAAAQAEFVNIGQRVKDQEKEFTAAKKAGFRDSEVARRGEAFTQRLSEFSDIRKEINELKPVQSEASESINSVLYDVLTRATAGATIGATAGSFIPIPGLGTVSGGVSGGLIGATSGYMSNASKRKEAEEATNTIISGLTKFQESLTQVTRDADEVAQAAAKRTFKYGGDLVSALQYISKNLGGDEQFAEIYGFDPSQIKSVDDYEAALKKAKATRRGAAEAEARSNSIIDEGITWTNGRTQAEIDAAKINAEQQKIIQQRANSAVQLLTANQSLLTSQQLEIEQRKRAIAIAKEQIGFMQAENALKDKIAKTDKRIALAEEKRNEINTGLKGSQQIIQGFGFGEIGQDLQSTFRNEKGTDQLLKVASNLEVGPQIQKAKTTNDALLALQKTLSTSTSDEFLKEEGNVKKFLLDRGLDDNTAQDIIKAIESSGGTSEAVDEVRKQRVQELGGNAFDLVEKRLLQLADRQRQLYEQQREYNTAEFNLKMKQNQENYEAAKQTIDVLSGYETPIKGIAQNAERANRVNRLRRSVQLRQDIATAKQTGDPNLERETIQRLIQVRQEEVDSIENKIKADIEYQKTVLRARSDLIKDYGFGTRSEKRGLRNTAGFASIAAQQNSLQGIPESQFAGIRSFLERFSDVKLPQFGGRKGSDILADISANETIRDARRSGVNLSKEQEDQIRKTARERLTKPQELEDQLKNARKGLTKVTEELQRVEKERIKNLRDLNQQEQQALNEEIIQAREGKSQPPTGLAASQPPQLPQGAQNAPQGNIKIDLQGQQEVVVQLVSNGDVSAAAEKKAYEAISQRFNQLADRIQVTAPELAESFRQEGIA